MTPSTHYSWIGRQCNAPPLSVEEMLDEIALSGKRIDEGIAGLKLVDVATGFVHTLTNHPGPWPGKPYMVAQFWRRTRELAMAAELYGNGGWLR